MLTGVGLVAYLTVPGRIEHQQYIKSHWQGKGGPEIFAGLMNDSVHRFEKGLFSSQVKNTSGHVQTVGFLGRINGY